MSAHIGCPTRLANYRRGRQFEGTSYLVEDLVDVQYSTHEGTPTSTAAFVSQPGAPPKMLVPTKGGDRGRYYKLPWSGGKQQICQVVLECLPDVREKFMLADPRSGGKLAMGFYSVSANNGSRAYTIARKPVYGAGGAVRYEDAAYRIVIGTWNGGPEALYRDGVGSGNIDTLDPVWREWLMLLYRDPNSSINQHPKMAAFTNPALFQAADEATHCVTERQGNSSNYFAYRQIDTKFTLASSIFSSFSMPQVIDELSIRLGGGAQGGLQNAPANSIVFAACSRAFTHIMDHPARRVNLVAGDRRGPGYWATIRRFRNRFANDGGDLNSNRTKALEEDAYRAVSELNREAYICMFGANDERTYFPLHPKFFKRLVYYDVSIVRPVHDPYAPDLNFPDG